MTTITLNSVEDLTKAIIQLKGSCPWFTVGVIVKGNSPGSLCAHCKARDIAKEGSCGSSSDAKDRAARLKALNYWEQEDL